MISIYQGDCVEVMRKFSPTHYDMCVTSPPYWGLREEAKTGDGGRNKRSVWRVTTKPVKEAHFATYPPDLIEPCILAGSRKGGAVLDPFGGSGTTGRVAEKFGRDSTLIELNPEYVEIAQKLIKRDMFSEVEIK